MLVLRLHNIAVEPSNEGGGWNGRRPDTPPQLVAQLDQLWLPAETTCQTLTSLLQLVHIPQHMRGQTKRARRLRDCLLKRLTHPQPGPPQKRPSLRVEPSNGTKRPDNSILQQIIRTHAAALITARPAPQPRS